MTVRFASLNDIKEFVGLATLQPFNVQVLDGARKVNAKSFMEMFTIEFANPLHVDVGCTENEAHFSQVAQKFLAES